MRKIILIIVLSLSGITAKSQVVTVDSLRKRIETLENTLNKEYYVQVPKKEFDKTLETTVKDEINNWINSRRITIITIWGILSFLLGFLLKYYFTENYRKKIDQKVNEETKSLNDKTNYFTKEMSGKFDDFENAANEKFNNLSDNLSLKGTIMDNRIKKIEEMVIAIQNEQNNFFTRNKELIENKINSTLSFIWDDIVDDYIRKAKERNYIGDELIVTFNKLLETNDIKLSEIKKIDLIDCLIRCYYFKKEIEGKLGDIMISVVEKYEKTLKLKPETFANVAIKSCDYYEYYGTSKFREATQLYCNKSINMLPDYGIPYAVLLELFMIDSKNSKNDTEKEKAVMNISDTFRNIKNNQSLVLPLEIIERIKGDEDTIFKKYLQELLIAYPLELNDIRERALQYLIENIEKSMETDKYMKVLDYILTYGVKTNQVIIDGSWELIETIDSGKSVPIKEIKETLLIDAAKFTISSGEASEEGKLYFLTGTDPSAMNLYFINPVEIEKGIYRTENENLIICVSSNGERPSEFLSTTDNKFFYRVYKRSVDVVNN